MGSSSTNNTLQSKDAQTIVSIIHCTLEDACYSLQIHNGNMDSAINYILAEGGKLSTPQQVVDVQGNTYTPNASSSLSAPSTNDDNTNPIGLKSNPIDLTSSEEHIVKGKAIDEFAQETDFQGIQYITKVHDLTSISSSTSTTPIAHYSHKRSRYSSTSTTPMNHQSYSYDDDKDMARKLHIELNKKPKVSLEDEKLAKQLRNEDLQGMEKLCPALFIECKVEEMYLVNCPKNHMISLEALYGQIKTNVADRVVPVCALANGKDGCRHILTEQEAEEILHQSMIMRKNYIEQKLREGKSRDDIVIDEKNYECFVKDEDLEKIWNFDMSGGEPVVQSLTYATTEKGYVSKAMGSLYYSHLLRSQNCIQCPNTTCKSNIGVIEKSSIFPRSISPSNQSQTENSQNSTQYMLVRCKDCDYSFCSECQRHYHYNASCDEIMTITRQWGEWIASGKSKWLEEMAKRNNKYKQQLSNFEARKKDHAKDAELHKQAYANLEADEAFKAKICKYCPKCNRVIEKMSGCDTMVCGQDAHGGNVQKGCGTKFAWSQAKAYKPDIGMRKDMEDFNAVPPTKQKLRKHNILEIRQQNINLSKKGDDNKTSSGKKSKKRGKFALTESDGDANSYYGNKTAPPSTSANISHGFFSSLFGRPKTVEPNNSPIEIKDDENPMNIEVTMEDEVTPSNKNQESRPSNGIEHVSPYLGNTEIYLKCDGCHEDIEGPIFTCIHCPSFHCCINCAQPEIHVQQLGSLPLVTENSSSSISTSSTITSPVLAPTESKSLFNIVIRKNGRQHAQEPVLLNRDGEPITMMTLNPSRHIFRIRQEL